MILTDSSGHTGVGEVPGGEKIRHTLEDARALIPAMLACADRVRARALAGMSEAEQDHFVRLLEQVRHNLTDEA